MTLILNRTLKLALFGIVALTAFGIVASPAAAEDEGACTGGHFQFCEQSMDTQPLTQSMETQPLEDNPCTGQHFQFCKQSIET